MKDFLSIFSSGKAVCPDVPAFGSGYGYGKDNIIIPVNSQNIVDTTFLCDKALVMFVGGSSDTMCKPVLRRLYPRYYVQNKRYQNIGYATWNSKALLPIIIAWHHAHKKICLVGHSWGGDTVMQIAKQLQFHHVIIDLICTVDPVSWRGKGGNLAKPKNVKKWSNVAVDYYRAAFTKDNIIAMIGGVWGKCKNADKNVIAHSVEVDGEICRVRHEMVAELFFQYQCSEVELIR